MMKKIIRAEDRAEDAVTFQPETSKPVYEEMALPVFSEEEQKEIVERCVTIITKASKTNSVAAHCEILFDTAKLLEVLSKHGKLSA